MPNWSPNEGQMDAKMRPNRGLARDWEKYRPYFGPDHFLEPSGRHFWSRIKFFGRVFGFRGGPEAHFSIPNQQKSTKNELREGALGKRRFVDEFSVQKREAFDGENRALASYLFENMRFRGVQKKHPKVSLKWHQKTIKIEPWAGQGAETACFLCFLAGHGISVIVR